MPVRASDNNDRLQFRIAIIGSGPSGFYAAEALLDSGLSLEVDLMERHPVPFGLVRHGVAPDHQMLKQVTSVFMTIAQRPGFSFLGNVTVGEQVSLGQLCELYDAVLITTGAASERGLGVAGEQLAGSVSATEFVGWYNGNPDYRHSSFDFTHPVAVVVGNGNVAIDIARILSKSVEDLRQTDICAHALEALAESKIEEVQVVGRRGPVQSKFTLKELRELSTLVNARVGIELSELALGAACLEEVSGPKGALALRNLETFRRLAGEHVSDDLSGGRRLKFRFLLSPVRLEGRERVERIVFERNRLDGPAFAQKVKPTGEYLAVDAGLVVRSVGYHGVAMPGAPFDQTRGIIPNREGRVVDAGGNVVPGLYVAGWIKRGPSGVIGTNRADSALTVAHIIKDLMANGGPRGKPAQQIRQLLNDRGALRVDFDDWGRIDAAEVSAGALSGKPREKFTAVDEMLAAAKPSG